MKYVENPIYGRKVFFLNPPLSVENVISAILKEKEYEVYIIREYTFAKPILRKFPNAICWIFIDDELSYEAWCNFIKSFEYDEELKSIFIGLLTIRAKPKDQEFFMINTQLPGGFVRLDQDVKDTTNQLIGILDLNGAKGTRKCIRLELEDKNDVIAYFSNGNNLFSFQLKEISPLGFSAVTPVQMAAMFKKNSFIRNVSITLGRYSFTSSIQIYHATTIGNLCLVVATFTDDTNKDILKKIHDYIYLNLEQRYKILTEEIQIDSTNYNIRPEIGNLPEEEKSESKAEATESTNEEVEEIEDAEEVETPEEVPEETPEASETSDESKENSES